MKSATSLPYSSTLVGAGIVNLQAALDLVRTSDIVDSIPHVVYIHPDTLPLSCDVTFLGDTYIFSPSIFSSVPLNLSIQKTGIHSEFIEVNPWVWVNQTSSVELRVNVPMIGVENGLFAGLDLMSSNSLEGSISISMYPKQPVAKVAIDTSLSMNSNHTIYSRYADLYRLLTSNNISTTEVNFMSEDSLNYFDFDAVILLSPYCSIYDEISSPWIRDVILPYSQSHADKLEDYFAQGGRILVAPSFTYQ